MPAMPAVEVNDLVVRFGGTTAVDRLDLRVETGSITAILGPNGAGKTTTIETCVGYRRPHGGSVRVLGADPGTARDRARLLPRIGVMPQDVGGYPGARPVELLRHAAALYAHPHEPSRLAELVGLSAGAQRTAYRRLSGGERQRLGLALAVIGRPELLFLDEPTAGMDPHGRHATWQLIGRLRAEGGTVVLSTHLMDEAERLADQVVIIDQGRVVATGSPAELTGLDADRTLSFRGPAGLDLCSLRTALPDRVTADEPVPGGYRIAGDLSPQVLATVTAWCAGNGVMPESLALNRRTLEDVFTELTGRELRS